MYGTAQPKEGTVLDLAQVVAAEDRRYEALDYLLGLDESFEPSLAAVFKNEFTAVPVQNHLPLSRQKLAFIGDSVIECIVRQQLTMHFPADIHRLNIWQGEICSNRTLAKVAVALGLTRYFKPRKKYSERLLGTILEAIYGLMYLRFGLEQAAEKIMPSIRPFAFQTIMSTSPVGAYPRLELNDALSRLGLNRWRYRTRESVPSERGDIPWLNVIELHIDQLGIFTGRAPSPAGAMDAAAHHALDVMDEQGLL